jgi:hypothetical protein
VWTPLAARTGFLLVDYLGVSEGRVVGEKKRMIADRNFELAATTLEWTKGRFPKSRALPTPRRLRLRGSRPNSSSPKAKITHRANHVTFLEAALSRCREE